MSLFINNHNHPDVYKNKETIQEPNQAYTRKDFLTELMLEQRAANASLRKAFEDLKKDNQLLLKNEIMDQMTHLSATTEDIVNRLDQNEITQQKLSSKLIEKLNFQQASAAQQEEFQANVLKRLDNQEALTEKISRQLNHIRSILFERTNYLATKVEDGYKMTSSYVYKLMTGSEQPLTFFLMNQKKEENQKHSD